MSLFSRKDDKSKARDRKVVVTGKRINGTWVMESKLPVRARRDKRGEVVATTENRRGRTLH